MALRVTAAAPAVERDESGTVNSLLSKATESFWLSLKRSRRSAVRYGPEASTT